MHMYFFNIIMVNVTMDFLSPYHEGQLLKIVKKEVKVIPLEKHLLLHYLEKNIQNASINN